ncbi:hypothetical protein NDU88_002664, partial [Pleurodeles waltl]
GDLQVASSGSRGFSEEKGQARVDFPLGAGPGAMAGLVAADSWWQEIWKMLKRNHHCVSSWTHKSVSC